MTIGDIPVLRNNAKIGEPEFSTLDEPIKDTIVRKNIIRLILTRAIHKQNILMMINLFFQLRDVRAIGNKFYHVLYPKEKTSLLKEC